MTLASVPVMADPLAASPRRTTRLLVSVRDASEAALVAETDVPLIDLKEPTGGSLGSVAPHLWPSIRQAIPAGKMASIALGELTDPSLATLAAAAHGFHFAKIGLAGCRTRSQWARQWQAVWERLPAGVTRVAVAYADARRADAPEPEDVLEAGTVAGCGALLVDTHDKKAGGLLDLLPQSRLERLVDDARRLRLQVVLAGSLRLDWLASLVQLGPDFVGVRGAVCRGDRSGTLDASLVRAWLSQLVAMQESVAR